VWSIVSIERGTSTAVRTGSAIGTIAALEWRLLPAEAGAGSRPAAGRA
jgi:hypothetical protein